MAQDVGAVLAKCWPMVVSSEPLNQRCPNKYGTTCPIPSTNGDQLPGKKINFDALFAYECSTDCDAGLNIVICIALDISTTKNDFNLGNKCMPYCHTFNMKITSHVCKRVEATLYASLYSASKIQVLGWKKCWSLTNFKSLQLEVSKFGNICQKTWKLWGWLLLEKCLQLEILQYYNYHQFWPNISMDTFLKPLIVYTEHCVAYVVPKLDTDSMCVSNCKQLRRCLSAPTPPSLWHYRCSVKWKRGCR